MILVLVLLFTEILVGFLVYRFKKNQFGSVLVPFTLCLLSLYLWAHTGTMPSDIAGPAALPRLYLVMMIIFCGLILWQAFKGKINDPAFGKLRRAMITLSILGGYAFSMQYLGYFFSSLVFISGLIYYLSYRNHLVIWLVSFSWIAFSYLVFYKLLFIQLPLGTLYETLME